MKDLNLFIDLIEYNKLNRGDLNNSNPLVNGRLLTNTFFLHNLVSKQINKLILVIEKFILRLKENLQSLDKFYPALNCLIGRLNYLLVKCAIKKLTRFNSIVELDFLDSLSILYTECFGLANEELKLKCVYTLNLMHLFSLLPFNTLIKQYHKSEGFGAETNSENEEDSNKNSLGDTSSGKSLSDDDGCKANSRNTNIYANLEVLAKKCKNVWDLFLIKRSFNLAKGFLYYNDLSMHHHHHNHQSNQTDENLRLDQYLKNCMTEKDFPVATDDGDSQLEQKQRKNSTTDDRSFYRDFTLKFNPTTKMEGQEEKTSSVKPSKPNISSMFANHENAENLFANEDEVDDESAARKCNKYIFF